MDSISEDHRWMKRCLALASRGQGRVSPNPLVGCVIVKNGEKIAEGFHRLFGGPHAEQVAFRKESKKIHGATLYVNLEPCVHFGKTPPCVPLIINNKIRRVVVGMKDPNPLVFGRGIQKLRKAGIKVDVGCLENSCVFLNRAFCVNMLEKRPFVALKTAMSLDGKTATKAGNSKWITSEAARRYAKKLRDDFDAILVGKNTVLRDNPALSGISKEPLRIVLDSSLQTSLRSKVYRNSHVLVIATDRAPISRLNQFEKRAISVMKFRGKTKIPKLLSRLYKERNIGSIFIEGGSAVAGSFCDAKLVDEVYFFIAPKIIGGEKAKSAVGGDGVSALSQVFSFNHVTIKKIGPDILLHAVKITERSVVERGNKLRETKVSWFPLSSEINIGKKDFTRKKP